MFLAVPVAAQLTAPGSSAVRYSNYPDAPDVKDPVFVFCNVSGMQKGTITATVPEGSAVSDFEWFRWSDNTKNFSEPVKTDVAVLSSTASNLDEGGYRVKISGGFDTVLTGWVFIDRPHSAASLMNRTCDYVALNGEAAVDTFFYRNPANGTRLILPNKINFLWSSTPASSIPYPDLEIDPQTFSPPLENVTYLLQVSDSFGCRSESSFYYESIHVKADFSVEPQKGEAPLEVTFTDKSIRGTYYKWEFGDSRDSISTLQHPEPHIYYRPGEYSVKLTIESDMHCIDSLRFDKIEVEKSELDIPNVFTPNDDGLNDRFVVQKKSLRHLSVEIYSRSGKRVYSFSGDGETLRNWEGWDGNVNNSSAQAAPGVYFYIINALGWDDVGYDSEAQRGFVYLYR
jgi:gliding motility-associated-like protein